MEIKAKTRLTFAGMTAGALLAGVNVAQACCPDGGHGAAVAVTGLGERAPKAENLALDPTWRIYEFERDGVTYLQINDLTGTVRAGVGQIKDTLWVLPMGKDVARVVLPAKNAGLHGTVAYRTSRFTVRAVPNTAGDAWVVTATH
ncbi:hypothetical protein [Xanthomonas theicola]|uniref:Secreted protein n=1 Tax=Xanthomonas theicola TaxID=56464 RepID=A0A2S6ZJI6_9XANT|nr:hypothetical protein [Xanthomonas theicola]PPT92417.1 hypothetical protein XthCFBP4691_04185 [Xanthomonas theicola]QNH25136.1 hypothetical protein G4Q83_10835 [Xanthomonas theicola]